jgi:hypothetical protein
MVTVDGEVPLFHHTVADPCSHVQAIMFGYLEILLRLDSPEKVVDETARLQSTRSLYAGSPMEETLDDFGESLDTVLKDIEFWSGQRKNNRLPADRGLTQLFDGSDPNNDGELMNCAYFLRVRPALNRYLESTN